MNRVPVLMYHNVGGGARHLNVSAQGLARQCQLLHRLRFRAITLRDLAQVMQSRCLPPRAVVFTFDDALLGVYEHALPILRRYGWTATVFAVSGRLGTVSDWAPGYHYPVMEAEHLQALHREGWDVGAHTLTHPRLTQLPEPEAFREIAQSREQLQQLIGDRVDSFCYPYGDYNPRVAQMVREAGYQVACTVRKGWVSPYSDPLTLPRVPVAYSDGATGLLYRLLRAWMRSRA